MENRAMQYAHGHMPELMKEAVEFYLGSMGPEEREAILGFVGHPSRGYDDSNFTVTTIILLDKTKSMLEEEEQWLGWKVSTGYRVTDSGHLITSRSGSRITSDSHIDEEDIIRYLQSVDTPDRF